MAECPARRLLLATLPLGAGHTGGVGTVRYGKFGEVCDASHGTGSGLHGVRYSWARFLTTSLVWTVGWDGFGVGWR